MTEEISARHLLFQNFGVQLPIAGGVGNSDIMNSRSILVSLESF